MKRTTIAMTLTVSALAVAACGTGAANKAAPAANASTNAASAPAGNASTGNAAAPASATGVSSDYTDLNLARCQVTSQSAEGEGDSISWRCPGRGDVPIFVNSGDLRYDIDAGVDNDSFETLPPFNENPDRIEWRVRDGRPFAIIYRLRVATNEQNEWSASVLGVAKVGAQGAPGCLVAWVDGAVANANDVARNIADTRAAGFACGSAEPAQVRRP